VLFVEGLQKAGAVIVQIAYFPADTSLNTVFNLLKKQATRCISGRLEN